MTPKRFSDLAVFQIFTFATINKEGLFEKTGTNIFRQLSKTAGIMHDHELFTDYAVTGDTHELVFVD